MKRTRKTRKTFTLTQKRGLVNQVIALLNKGVKITKARLDVAHKNGTTPISLARWATNPTITTVAKSNGKIVSQEAQRDARLMAPYKKFSTESLRHTTNKVNKIHVTSVDLHVPGQGIVKLDHDLLTHISKLAGYTG